MDYPGIQSSWCLDRLISFGSNSSDSTPMYCAPLKHATWMVGVGNIICLLLTFFAVLQLRDIANILPLESILDTLHEPPKYHTFIGDDFPRNLDVKMSPVVMFVEESVRYSVTGAEAHDEWLYTSPPGTGVVQLGPDGRAFFVSMFHQLHCLRLIRNSLSRTQPNIWEHTHHCFTYLRERVLCQADRTLEPDDFTKRNFSESRTGATHVCRDWTAVYDDVAMRWIEWTSKNDTY